MKRNIKWLVPLMLSVIIVVFVILSPAAVARDLPFTDVKRGAWYYSAVESVYGEGIMKGKSESRFAPRENVTRAELVTVLYRLSGDTFEGAQVLLSFTDTKNNAWYSDSVAWAVESGIISGYPDGSFKPNKAVIRQELAKMVALFLDRMDVTHTDRSIIDRFADGSMFKKWASQYIERLRKAGVIGGDENGCFAPRATASRAEIATVIMRLIPLINADGTESTTAEAPIPQESTPSMTDAPIQSTVPTEAPVESSTEATLPSETEPTVIQKEIFAPTPQMPADGSKGSDFDVENCRSADIFAAFDSLCAEYPEYISGELLGYDTSGDYEIKRYVLSTHSYEAWCREGYPRMYAWVSGETVVYSLSVSPRIGDVMYSVPYIGDEFARVTHVDTPAQTRSAGGMVFTHDPGRDVEPTLIYTLVENDGYELYDVTGKVVGRMSSVEEVCITDENGTDYMRYPFGDRNRSMDEPFVLVLGANEHGPDPDPTLCAVICTRLAGDLCRGTDNPMLNYLRDNVMLVIMPVINPYGFDLGESSPYGTGYYNANCVNINRNYDCPGFGLENNAGPCGEYGGSEIETQYFMNTLAEPNTRVGISLHALGHRTEGVFNGVANPFCHYQGNGFDQTKLSRIRAKMRDSYSMSFTSYNVAPLETTAKSPTYITKVGARGGIIEMQPMEGDSLRYLTGKAMEANYTLLLDCMWMWITDALGV
ncbi:MAG: S-layer homology domain-containing protein [Clostridia bacterium]|nr:S-layer homology domain-containing protein [Clostridia bacterium]